MQLSSYIVQLVLASQALASPSFPNFVQNVFSSEHQILLENPQILKDFHAFSQDTLAESHMVESAWKHLLHEVTPETLDFHLKKSKTLVSQAPMQKSETPTTVFDSDEANDGFEVLEHSSGNYGLRVKSGGIESLDLDTVEQYVGYFDVRDVDKHFFYWFFESRNDPKTDPILLWLNGGPGCASEGGLFFELGPSFIDGELKPVFNPYAWNANASVIFLDQPVGVGYSYAGKEDVDSSDKAARDVYVFLELFFQKFPEFLKNDFHVSGESYAGHYIPRIAAEIIRHPERSFELSSVLIGNGAVDMPYQRQFDHKMLCEEGGVDIISPENCTVMEENLQKCLLFERLCGVVSNVLTCVPASYYCELTYGPLNSLGLNRYDLRRPCEDDRLCYKDMTYVADYMNQDYVKEATGVPKNLEFEVCKREVGKRFGKTHDGEIPFQKFIAEVLDYGVPVLNYAGDKDFVCHWVGYNAVSNQVKHKNQEAFVASEFVPWVSGKGEEVGQVRNYENFTFLRVYDAGHMVPHDQPEIALEMLNQWLKGNYKFE